MTDAAQARRAFTRQTHRSKMRYGVVFRFGAIILTAAI